MQTFEQFIEESRDSVTIRIIKRFQPYVEHDIKAKYTFYSLVLNWEVEFEGMYSRAKAKAVSKFTTHLKELEREKVSDVYLKYGLATPAKPGPQVLELTKVTRVELNKTTDFAYLRAKSDTERRRIERLYK